MPRIKSQKPITLGNQVRDIVTGFTGIAISEIKYLNGCVQFGVKGSVKEGKMPDTHYIDVEQLEYVGKGVTINPQPTGGFQEDAPRM